MLAAAGFELTGVQGDYERVPATADTRFLIYHARKPGGTAPLRPSLSE
jgi:hypothetical protein